MKTRQIREIQVASSQLALIFLAILAVAIVIFLLGVSIGKKYSEAQLEASGKKVTALPEVKTLTGETSIDKKAESSLIAAKVAQPEKMTGQIQKIEPEPIKLPEIPPVKKTQKPEKTEIKPPIKDAPEAKIAQPGSKAYFVQIAAFSRKEASTSLIQELRKAGYQTIVLDPLPTDKTPIYRVRIGPFSSETEAEAAKNKVKYLIPAASKVFIVRH